MTLRKKLKCIRQYIFSTHNERHEKQKNLDFALEQRVGWILFYETGVCRIRKEEDISYRGRFHQHIYEQLLRR